MNECVILRLDRLLSSRGYCTRSHARTFLKGHAILEAGKPVTRDDQRVDGDNITIDGEPADPGRIVAMFHKPTGVICSHDDGEGELVYDLLPDRWSQRNPVITTVGRLDKDTSGLLLVTDDGALVHRLTSPKKHIAKTYRVKLAMPLQEDEAALLVSGTLSLKGDTKPLLPAKLERLGDHDVRLTITEGRYHQVRRMFVAVGNHVDTLHREQVGNLTLGDLAPGTWRMLTEDEIALAGVLAPTIPPAEQGA